MLAVAYGLLAAAAASCGHPCRDLSEAVCRCAQSPEQESRCLRQIRGLASQDRAGHDAASAQACAALLSSCTCERLAAGDLAACGLATQNR